MTLNEAEALANRIKNAIAEGVFSGYFVRIVPCGGGYCIRLVAGNMGVGERLCSWEEFLSWQERGWHAS